MSSSEFRKIRPSSGESSASASNPSQSKSDITGSVSLSLITIAGKRHRVRIETEHLACHDLGNVDLLDIPAQSLKAILWGRWQGAWGSQPPDPSDIKLVHFGQTIDDFTPLRCTFPTFGNVSS